MRPSEAIPVDAFFDFTTEAPDKALYWPSSGKTPHKFASLKRVTLS
jgi:hypothetical protein